MTTIAHLSDGVWEETAPVSGCSGDDGFHDEDNEATDNNNNYYFILLHSADVL